MSFSRIFYLIALYFQSLYVLIGEMLAPIDIFVTTVSILHFRSNQDKQ